MLTKTGHDICSCLRSEYSHFGEIYASSRLMITTPPWIKWDRLKFQYLLILQKDQREKSIC